MPRYYRYAVTSQKGMPIAALGVPLPKVWSKITRDNPNVHRDRGWAYLKEIADGHAIIPWWQIPWVKVWCREHHRHEIVPAGNYNEDLWHWYDAGFHPRWSVLNVLIRLGAQYWETVAFVGRNRQAVRTVTNSLRASKGDRQAFIRLMRQHVNVTLYARGRRYRVLPGFRAKYRNKTFTVTDFLNEQNQELRRLMLGRGVEVKNVVDRMAVEVSSKEGRILTYNGQRYLHVTCPSTQQQYLLGIPTWAGEARRRSVNGKWIDPAPLETVAAARRWTFNLPEDAVFAQEA